ncbi:MAG: hypothetical protein SWK90_17165 [Chloroflexota bacterium]|nr:hypothetical protein [Chloroflexota bacterium]
METPNAVWVAGGVAILALVTIYVLFALRSRRINLTRPKSPDQKPEWMLTTPPPETIAATQADSEGIALYDYDADEHLAAPFAEQIEDIIRSRLSADPALAAVDVDLGTTSNGGLTIWMNGECYTDISDLPDERLRDVIRQAVEEWNAGKQEQT